MQYKLVPERRETLKEMWWQRLQCCQRLVEDWQKVIQVHSLVLHPQEDLKSWLKYASLCRKNRSVVSFFIILDWYKISVWCFCRNHPTKRW